MVIDSISDINQSEIVLNNINNMDSLSSPPCLSVDYATVDLSIMTPGLRSNSGLAIDNLSVFQYQF